VAVLLDNDHPVVRDKTGGTKRQTRPRSPQEIQKIHEVVAAAVGLDADRGDRLTVENIAFEELPVDDEPVPDPWWKRAAPTAAPALLDATRVGAVLLVALLIVFLVLRPAMKKMTTTLAPAVLAMTAPVAMMQPPRTVADMEGEMDAELLDGDQPDPERRRLPALTRRVAKLTQAEPENAARLVRSWLTESDH
jgi:flagellar M-ring protein FliF